MLDYLACSPAYPSLALPAAPHKYPFPSIAPQPFSPASSAFTFDPFADDDDSASSAASHAPPPDVLFRPRAAPADAQRGAKVEFLKQREWMRRVVAWVEGVNPGLIPSYTTPYTPPPHGLPQDTPLHLPADANTPYTIYSTAQPHLCTSPEPAAPQGAAFDEEEEPYIIYSTPRLGAAVNAPAPRGGAAPIVPPRTPTGRHVHSRVPSLDSIREEDEREDAGVRL